MAREAWGDVVVRRFINYGVEEWEAWGDVGTRSHVAYDMMAGICRVTTEQKSMSIIGRRLGRPEETTDRQERRSQ